MTSIEILKYSSYGYALGLALFVFVLSNDLMNGKFFRRCFVAALLSCGLGVHYEYTNTFQTDKWLTLVVMSTSLIYLLYFEFLRSIFRNWTGTDPYVTSAGSWIGSPVHNGIWTKRPYGRRVMASDILFSLILGLASVGTIFGLLALIKNEII